MSLVTFGSLKVGDTFTYQGKEYTKTEKIKISCCKFINAQVTAIPRDKAAIRDDQQVEVKD